MDLRIIKTSFTGESGGQGYFSPPGRYLLTDGNCASERRDVLMQARNGAGCREKGHILMCGDCHEPHTAQIVIHPLPNIDTSRL